MIPPVGITLIGPRAAGKTTLGRALATALGLQFVDTDAELGVRAGMSAGDFLRSAGEPAFRQLEEQVVLAALAAADGSVIALGGGALGRATIRAELARPRLWTVFVHAPLAVLVERQRADGQRPGLTGLPLADEVAMLWASRLPAWRAVADGEIDTGHQDVAAAVARLIDGWQHRRTGV